jgi:polysaccharide export outer membrane protein
MVAVTSGGRTRQHLAQVDARGDLHAASERDVRVAGLQLDDAEGRVTDAIRTREKDAEVNLHLALGLNQRISVLGALTRPGFVTLTPGMRVVDIVAAAGGVLTLRAAGRVPPAPVADLEGSVLLRNGRALPISVREALRGEPKHNVYIYPGDQLYVPLATDQLVSVFGQVRAPGVFLHRRGMRLTEALSEAGGITRGGDKTDVRLLRGPVTKPQVYRSNLSAIAEGTEHDVALAPGDVLFVQDHPMEDAGEVLGLLLPIFSVGISALLVTFLVTS